ncbi:MAG: integrase [Motiliproteus sp.]|jgi:integrase
MDFSYQGIRCRETIKAKPTASVLKEISRKRETILYEISMGSFDYGKHFPASKNASRFSAFCGDRTTIESALNEWFKRNQRRFSLSTIRDYLSSMNFQLIPVFGDLNLDQLSPSVIRDWMAQQTISAKRINNILVPLRQTYKEAFEDELIEKDPLQRVRNLKVSKREPKPFNSQEIRKILAQLEGPSRNLIEFAFGSGLRTSELIALKWDDVDIDAGVVHVREAEVLGQEKTTKTVSGMRTVELMQQAIEALKDQKAHGYRGSNHVFFDPKSGKAWKDNHIIRNRIWTPALKKAGVEYRNPYQTRHTFASTLLSQGKNPLLMAQQMGHKDWGMIRTTYGRWIKES